MITDSQVSVVVQGPIHRNTPNEINHHTTHDVIQSIRKWLPGAEIILSTWQGSDCEGLTPDITVKSEDPGAITLSDSVPNGACNNLNRMIVSTKQGVRQCSRPYVLKLRTDCLVTGEIPFSVILQKKMNSRWRVFESGIMILNVYTRHPLRRPVLFHLSDLVHFGRRCDIEKLWNVSLVEEPFFTRTIDSRCKPYFNSYPEDEYLFRCAPEQYLAETLAKEVLPHVHLRHHSDGCTSWLFGWLHVLATNFVILTPADSNIQLPDRMEMNTENYDLFSSRDERWLSKWNASTVPILCKLETVLLYFEARIKFSKHGGHSAISRLRRIYQKTIYNSYDCN
jgi:hypothetical protein